MDPVYFGPLRRLSGIDRRGDDVDVYATDVPADYRAHCQDLLEVVGAFHPPFAPLRRGVDLRFFTRAALPFQESLAHLQGAPLEIFTIKDTWKAFVNPLRPKTIYLSAQLRLPDLLGVVAHECLHVVQNAQAGPPRAAARWARDEVAAERFARSFGVWFEGQLALHEGAA